MSRERDDEQNPAVSRRRVRLTVAALAITAGLIYLGFIARGVFG